MLKGTPFRPRVSTDFPDHIEVVHRYEGLDRVVARIRKTFPWYEGVPMWEYFARQFWDMHLKGVAGELTWSAYWFNLNEYLGTVSPCSDGWSSIRVSRDVTHYYLRVTPELQLSVEHDYSTSRASMRIQANHHVVIDAEVGAETEWVDFFASTNNEASGSLACLHAEKWAAAMLAGVVDNLNAQQYSENAVHE